MVDPDGGVRVLGVGEVLPLPLGAPAGRRCRSTSRARSRSCWGASPLDFVHVHEPFAPSAGSVALRHSRALNVGSFHAPTERSSRPRSRAGSWSCSSAAWTRARRAMARPRASCMERYFPAPYGSLRPGDAARAPHARTRPAADRLRRPRGAGGAAAVPARAAAAARGPRRGRPSLLARGWRIAAAAAPRPAERVRSTWRRRGRGVLDRRRRRRRRVHRQIHRAPALLRARAAPPARFRSPPACRCTRRCSRRRPRPAVRARRRRDARRPARRALRDEQLRAGLARPASAERRHASWARVADEVEAIYGRARRAAATTRRGQAGALRQRLAGPAADRRRPAHAHRPLQRLRHAGGGAAGRRRESAGPGRDRGDRPQRDLRRARGARQGRETGSRSSSARRSRPPTRARSSACSSRRRSRAAMTLQETIAEIQRQGGLVYVPHPFDRLHAVPDYEHLLRRARADVDAIEVFNPRVAIPVLQRGGRALRRQVPDRGRRGLGQPTSPRGSGSVRIRMRDFDGPEEFLESLRDADIIRQAVLAALRAGPGAEVPADQGHPAGAPRAATGGARSPARCAGRGGS